MADTSGNIGIGNGVVYFDTTCIRKDSPLTLEARILAIEVIIDTLLTTVLEAALTGNITEYTLNDGMTTIKGIYRDPNQIYAAIRSMERLKALYLKKLNGTGQIRLIDKKSFIGWQR